MGTTRTLFTRAFQIAMVILATGCSTHYPPIALEGSPQDLASLVGDWSGEYVDRLAGQPGGSIIFTLRGGDDRAYGDVLMTRTGASQAYRRYDPDQPTGYVLGATSQRLTISVVRARGERVTGELDPYWDFDRECPALTVFHGHIEGDVIKGTYETTYRGRFARRTGTWQVRKSEAKRP